MGMSRVPEVRILCDMSTRDNWNDKTHPHTHVGQKPHHHFQNGLYVMRDEVTKITGYCNRTSTLITTTIRRPSGASR